jgi:dihydroorotase
MRVIRGRVYYRGRLEPLSLGIDEEGRIAAIRKVMRGDEETDHGEALILPGAVDIHVHMRDPGLTQKEDFPSGTRSAAIGGVTTIADMPNTEPPVTSRAALDQKVAHLRGRSAIDYLLYAAPRSAESARSLGAAGAFKVYMAESTGGLQVGVEDLDGVVREAERQRKITVVHAENPSKFRMGRASDLRDYSAARPKDSETSALAIVGKIRGEAVMHVAHVTCVEAIGAVPPGVTSEVTPHHLFLDWSRPLGARGKVNPPLRSREDRGALWDAFRQGRIDVVASDHAPHTLEEKGQAFEEAPAGLPGVATTFPLLMRHTRAGDLDLPRLVGAIASRPAEILNIPKGVIEVGRDADLIVIDPRAIETIRAKRLRYKCGWTPFDGMEGCFPDTVYLRGERVVEDGEVAVEGHGRLLEPPA